MAIKTVDAARFRSISEVEQIQEETNVLASLKHPNIIRLSEARERRRARARAAGAGVVGLAAA